MALIILDRDGVINEDADDYIKSPAEWHAIPGSLEAIARLTQHGYQTVIATNQAGLARKLFDIDSLNAIHGKMNAHLARYGGAIDAIFFCPHSERAGCDCRKPRPGLYNQISERLRIPLHKVFCVGDKMSDIKASQGAGGKPVLVRTGKGQAEVDSGRVPAGLPVYADLAAFVRQLLDHRRRV